jgi:starch-binding outer membrane protein, SusD/RagB family
MKKVNYKILLPVSLIILTTVLACSKSFLDKKPIGTLKPEDMTSQAGIQGLLIGAYSLVDGEGASGDGFASGASNWLFGGAAGDDAYKGSDPSDVADGIGIENWSITPVNGALQQKWNMCYSGIQRCNDVLRTIANTEPLPTTAYEEFIKTTTGEVKFLRSFYNIELKKVFKNGIWADESVVVGNTDVSNATDNWPKIEADLTEAISKLPEAQPNVGQANVWAAKALLAKAYMFQNKFPDAYTLLKDIDANGKTSNGTKYALKDHFYSNFNPAQKNNSEQIFAAQTSVQDGSSVAWGGDPNGNYGDILNFPYNGGPGGCCGFYNPSQDLANAYKTDANGLPLLDNWFATPWVSEDSVSLYTGTLDPRIDWTLGRQGIPYLDWGNHPGDKWIRNPGADGHFSPKKNVYALSQKNFTDAGSAYWGPTQLVANNVNIIRFADVLLWAAECAADAGDYAAAVGYVNRVRARAADATGWVYKNSDYDAASATYKTQTTAADKYKIGLYTSFASKDYALKAIRFERRLELAMEGNRFFDLVRYGIADQVLNPYNEREKVARTYRQGNNFVKGKNEYFPIPQREIDNLNADGTVRLVQNPGY